MELEGQGAETDETVQKEAKAAKDETESGALAGFSPAGSTRTSKVFQFFLVSESTQQVACLKCKKKLKGINTSNCFSHLSLHDSVFHPDVQAFLKANKAKHDEKQQAEEKALRV